VIATAIKKLRWLMSTPIRRDYESTILNLERQAEMDARNRNLMREQLRTGLTADGMPASFEKLALHCGAIESALDASNAEVQELRAELRELKDGGLSVHYD